MLKFAPYVLKTLWRHRTRTLLTVSGSAVALFVYCFVQSLHEGLNRLTSRQETSLVVFQANKFCPATSHLPQDYDQVIAEFPGVKDVVPIQVFTNNCRASLDVVVFYGVPAEKIRHARDFELLEGSWDEFERNQDAGVVGRSVAERKDLQTGDKFSIGGVTVTVAGVFASQDRAEENYVYTHLDFLQRTRGLDLVGTVTQHEVLLEPAADAEGLCEAIDDRFRAGPVETDTRPKGVFQAASLADLVDLIELARYLAYSCVGLMVVLVSTTTIMAVEDRIREHAILQTIGFASGRIFSLVMAESVLMSIAGGLLGVGSACLALFASGLSVGAEAVTIAFAPSTTLALYGMATSLVIGLVAGLAPAWHAARAEIVPALREL